MLLRSAPYFPVADVAMSAAHYEQVLGFHPDYIAGTQFAIMSRDGLAVMLRLVPEPEKIRPSESQGGTWDAFFWVSDVKALHEELRGKGAVIVHGPVVRQAYGMEEFAVRDCDGHVLGFGQPVGSAPPGTK